MKKNVATETLFRRTEKSPKMFGLSVSRNIRNFRFCSCSSETNVAVFAVAARKGFLEKEPLIISVSFQERLPWWPDVVPSIIRIRARGPSEAQTQTPNSRWLPLVESRGAYRRRRRRRRDGRRCFPDWLNEKAVH